MVTGRGSDGDAAGAAEERAMNGSQTYEVELRIEDDDPRVRVGEKIGVRIREETGSPHRVRVEAGWGRSGKRYTFVVQIEAPDQQKAASVVAAAAAEAYRLEGRDAPSVYDITITAK